MNPTQLIHIQKHPVFKKYYELIEKKASEEEIDLFYASVFKVSADTMYLIPRDNDGTIELLKERTEKQKQLKVYKNITEDEEVEYVAQDAGSIKKFLFFLI